MNIQISGHQIDLGESLQAHVTRRLEEVVSKYFGRSIEASVGFKRDGAVLEARIVAHANARTRVTASATSDDAYRAFDLALERVGKRLRRHKRWLSDHHAGAAAAAPTRDASRSGRHALMRWDGELSEEAPNEAVIVAELDTPIEVLTVADAVRTLDVGEEPALVFRNAGTGAVNVVYRRTDGNVGWIEP